MGKRERDAQRETDMRREIHRRREREEEEGNYSKPF